MGICILCIAAPGHVGAVTVAEGTTEIERYAFYGHRGVTDVILSDSVTGIDISAFQASTVRRFFIPVGVTVIAYDAFRSCAYLTDVYYGGTAEQWAAIEIGLNNEALTSATVHCNATMP